MSIGGAGRDDVEPSTVEGFSYVRCVRCHAYRGTFADDALPAPGECVRCRARDPRRYWTRDWEKASD